MNDIPVVTCFMLTYNNLEYIYEALDSVFAQTYPKIEIAIFDDCSREFPRVEIEQYIQKNKRENIVDVIIFQSPVNQGTVKNFNNLIKNSELNGLSDVDRVKFIEDTLKFIMHIENNGLDTIVYAKSLWHNNFKDRSNSVYALELMIMFYYDVMKYLSGTRGLFFEDKLQSVQAVSEKNNYISIAKKIEYIDEAKNNIKRNLNVNLLIDKLIIEMCGD